MRPMIPWLALTLGLAACQTDRPTASSTADLTSGKEGALRVYTQNLYVGADVDKVIAAPPAQLPSALFQALATFVATDYPSRAGRIADEIGRASGPGVIAVAGRMAAVGLFQRAPRFGANARVIVAGELSWPVHARTNIERRTSNIEHRTGSRTRPFDVRCSMFIVRYS